MQVADSKKQKHLRILIYYKELTKHKIDYEECLNFMSYQFCISQRYIVRILKNYTEKDFPGINLEHADLDYIMIDAYVKKLYKEAIKTRTKEQLKLF